MFAVTAGYHRYFSHRSFRTSRVGQFVLAIPRTARMFAVVDVWDALKSDRPYREGWSTERVREYILSKAGTHFDPDVVAVFLTLI